VTFQTNTRCIGILGTFIENKAMSQTLYFDTWCGNNDTENANLFNEFFYSVFTRNSNPIDSNNLTSGTPSPLTEVEFTDYDIYNTLANLDTSKAVVIDGIGPRVLKKCALPLCYPLHVLFTKCIDQCAIPSEWAVHIVIPVYKSGEKNLVNNYMPISLLCNTSKIFEKLQVYMTKWLVLFLTLFL